MIGQWFVKDNKYSSPDGDFGIYEKSKDGTINAVFEAGFKKEIAQHLVDRHNATVVLLSDLVQGAFQCST